jgi:hypothetical protein
MAEQNNDVVQQAVEAARAAQRERQNAALAALRNNENMRALRRDVSKPLPEKDSYSGAGGKNKKSRKMKRSRKRRYKKSRKSKK